LKDQFMQNQPNMWAALMRAVSDILIIMFVLGTPYMAFDYNNGYFQSRVVVFACLQTLPWLCTSTIVQALQNPFTSDQDMFNSDALIASSEKTAFANIRSGFRMQDRRKREEDGQAESFAVTASMDAYPLSQQEAVRQDLVSSMKILGGETNAVGSTQALVAPYGMSARVTMPVCPSESLVVWSYEGCAFGVDVCAPGYLVKYSFVDIIVTLC